MADERVRKMLKHITATEQLRGSNRHKSDVHGHRFKKRASCLRTLVLAVGRIAANQSPQPVAPEAMMS